MEELRLVGCVVGFVCVKACVVKTGAVSGSLRAVIRTVAFASLDWAR